MAIGFRKIMKEFAQESGIQPLPAYYFVVIFLVAFATVAYQVLLTRMLSVLFQYHFAFAGITLAMLGLTKGAMTVFLKPKLFDNLIKIKTQIARHNITSAVTIVLALILASSFSVFKISHGVNLILAGIAVLFTFINCGVSIALLLTKFSRSTSKLYAFDLCGAALSCIAMVIVLKFIDPVSTILIIAALLAVAGYIFAPLEEYNPLKKLALKTLVASFALLALLQTSSYLLNKEILYFNWAKYVEHKKPIFERWNTYSRIDITKHGLRPWGWGFGKKHTEEQVEQLMLHIDADASTVLTKFNGDFKKVGYLKNDVINVGYFIRDIQDVAVIGLGGGRDILSALVFGAKHVVGVELNPAIIEALTVDFADYVGNLAKRPEVEIVNEEARSYLNETRQNFDFIQISLVDTLASTAAGGLTLSESKLYTVEAYLDYFNRLNKDGMFSVSRWFKPWEYEQEYLKLLAISTQALQKIGVRIEDVKKHILAVNAQNIITVLTSKSEFTAAELKKLKQACSEQGFEIIFSPDGIYQENAYYVTSIINNQKLLVHYPFDITASTDDRPYFFFFNKFNSLQNDNVAIVVLLFLTVTTAIVLVQSCTLSLYRRRAELNLRGTLPHLIYFASIGFGFMLIEMAIMQRLMIFLGHPVYALTVVLFTLLFSSGLGSYTVIQRTLMNNRDLIRLSALLSILILYGLTSYQLTEYGKYYGIFVRVLVSVLIIAPSGFFMGMMFPLGVLVSQEKYGNILAWLWCLNGAASIFSSIAAVLISILWGISTVYWIGVIFYIFAVLCYIYKHPGLMKLIGLENKETTG